ncbi:MAG TPA: hypothetical protein VM911_03260 [Pyrinomonadaceae bacterium]|jgi:hypothetical protein|nr:hypothetical protein [Pyrinomonadaceae bacterium]
MSLSLEAGEESFVAVVACKPYDSLRELIESLTALVDGNSRGKKSRTVKWSCEPDELDFKITLSGDSVSLKVVHYTDHRRSLKDSRAVFTLQSSRLEFCLAFWRALRALHRDIETDEFDRNWRRPFPHTEMLQLTESVRAFKRQAKA